MKTEKRKIIVKNRISMFSLRLVEISGAKLIRLVHKYSGDFYNPSSSKEPLFWRDTICGGDGSYIDIPENLRRVSSTIHPKDIYSFREPLINGKSMRVKKKISFKNLNQIEFKITCNKIAEPRRTYHVSYVEGGLYECDDTYGDEIRSKYVGNHVIIIEKPENLPVDINLFGENAKKKVLWNSSRLCVFLICGNLTSGNGFLIHWRAPRTNELDRKFEVTITNKLDTLEKNQQRIMEGIREVKTEVAETRELSEEILTIVEQDPERVKASLNDQLDELRQILLNITKLLKNRDPQKAKEARRWFDYLDKGINVTADLIQIITFLLGIPSLPALVESDLAKRIIEFLKRMTSTA